MMAKLKNTVCILLSVALPIAAADLRVASNVVVQAQTLQGGMWTNIALQAGGRVGNWRPDNAISGGVIVLDAAIGDFYPTDIFTMPAPTGPSYYGQLTSITTNWTAGNPSVMLPKPGKFIGNPWFCPTSNSHPENEYILFQAQDNSSIVHGSPANPGAGVDNQLYSMSSNFGSVPAGAAVRVGTAFPYSYSIISGQTDAQHLCLQDALTAGSSQTFAVDNVGYIEPHRYVTDGGDLYFSTNSLAILHDSVGARYNVGAGTLQILNQGYPPGTTPPGISNPTNSWFNEFLAPIPSFKTITSAPPIGRAIFMSDRAVTSADWSKVPEYSDHYMCGPPNCQLPVRMTEYNNANGTSGADSDCTTSACQPAVAVRGAWGPTMTQYFTLNQYIKTPASGSYAELHLYNLQFPQAELGGHSKLSGYTILK